MEIIGNGHLAKTITEGLQQVGVDGNYTIIAIDTPIDEKFEVDLTPIIDAIRNIKDDSLVILMSPVPVGTCKELQKWLGRELVYNPENLRLNAGAELYINADRQVIGTSSQLLFEQIYKFYNWYKGSLLFMSLESAELSKHTTNGFLGVSILFANEIERISKKTGANIEDVMKSVKADSRIGQKAYLTPGEPSKHLRRDLKILDKL